MDLVSPIRAVLCRSLLDVLLVWSWTLFTWTYLSLLNDYHPLLISLRIACNFSRVERQADGVILTSLLVWLFRILDGSRFRWNCLRSAEKMLVYWRVFHDLF